MPAKVNIRKATQSDIKHLIGLNRVVQEDHVAIAPEVYRDDSTDTETDDFWSARLEDVHCTAAIAVLDDLHVVGSILFELQEKPATVFAYAHRFINIHQLVVAPDHRRLGVATMLMNFAEDNARRKGVKEVRLAVWAANLEAQSFYVSLGYDDGIVVRRKFLL
jgi:ribosomal protein S18 acetylase RimI-like enzyme